MNTIAEKARTYTDSTDTRVFGSEETLDATELIQKGYIAGATEALTAQWRSVEDETPEEGEYVIIDGPNGIKAAVWNEHYQVWDDAEGDDFMYKKDAVKMWMSIPQPPVYARTT